MLMQAKGLTNQTLDSIAYHGIALCTPYGDTHARVL